MSDEARIQEDDEESRFLSVVTAGKIKGFIAQKIAQLLAKMVDGQVVIITVRRYKKTRSNQQNRYYWGVIVKRVQQMFEDAGTTATQADIHDYLKMHVGGYVKFVKAPDGTFVPRPDHSRKRTTTDFMAYCEKCRAWAANLGVDIPPPESYVPSYEEDAAYCDGRW